MMTDNEGAGLGPAFDPFEEPGREALGTCTGDRFVLRKPLGQGGNAVVWQARDRLMGRFMAIGISCGRATRPAAPLRRRGQSWRISITRTLLGPVRVASPRRGSPSWRWSSSAGRAWTRASRLRGRSRGARSSESGCPGRGRSGRTACAGRNPPRCEPRESHARGGGRRSAGREVDRLRRGAVVRYLGEPEAEDSNPKPPRRPTDVGVAIGTSGYMPLEAGLGPADERFDVYSLGVTLHKLCTGTRPGIEAVRPLGEVYPACDAPADVTTVLAAALALEPGDRTQTAAELGRALAAVRAAHPEHTTSPLVDDRYERICLLGTGAKGDVFLANHRGGGHDVALEFLALDAARRPAPLRA